ncbi:MULTISPECIES: SDR family oxidoreductase [unclassified Leeuwenhoekiella]|uniref:SDR family oxidoreductase n=1 Tax=unclassified Leeuwenhoekiella TaxID=2615029 RepID=UPI000C37709D|nr:MULTISPECIES: SDR family oxidoreductase [unclassified Leeuwenhoekiella]MAW97009.1 NAD(P)-dependent oxidoreductase [Leeuwenhoekiella sp.]MBA80709.1 NAD(P)-dependent oxidoreductase [Leeuwenhoekiella sp.]|tara:strand:- start:8628 stop:9476 length:849 start_codon:yes stop_codon:yes gene_type:complete
MTKPKKFPEQEQELPGSEQAMDPQPEIVRSGYTGSDKLKNKVALITGGDSGIGRSVAVHFAIEGASVAIIYKSETEDALDTKKLVEEQGQTCLLIEGDVRDADFCKEAVAQTRAELGHIHILVNNAAVQFPKDHVSEIEDDQLATTFETNIYPYFFFAKALENQFKSGDCVINSTSVTAYRGSSHLLDYSSTKGAITTFTRSLSKMWAPKNIRVNGVAPGPIWTPLIPATFDDVSDFGQDVPLGRAGQPSEVAPAYVFLASADSSYITGQVIHVNGGEVVGA